MEYIHADMPQIGEEALLTALTKSLTDGKRTLWLICGGSNIAVATRIMQSLSQNLSKEQREALTILQTDERYGSVGHPDSNWEQMRKAGFPFESVKAFPILLDVSLEETVERYAVHVEEEFKKAEEIIALFGIGADSHIAGILPHSPASSETLPVSGYVAEPFTRITITFPMIRKIGKAYVFAFGEDKKRAMESLRSHTLPLEEAPCHILKEILSVFVYSNWY